MAASTAVAGSAPDARSDLKQSWSAFRRANPKVRIRDAADRLGVSEAELVATSCGDGTVRLGGDWRRLLERLEELGPVMALTRNEHAVHEKEGLFRDVHFHGRMGLVLDEGIDLRLFMDHWHHGFAVETEGRRGPLRSFQFFDRHGTAVHKVYLTEESNRAAWRLLIDEYADVDQSPRQCVCPALPPVPEREDAAIDVAGLEAAWRALEDTHDFHRLLARFQVRRVQALRLVDDSLASRVDPSSLAQVLHRAARERLAIMVFVASPGVIQIHSGPVETVRSSGPWINVLDDGFNLHVREDRVDTAWVVKKPTRDGEVASLEVYDDRGETIALLFARRKQGPEAVDGWNAALAGLERVSRT